jgi:hypothetical protein
MIPVEYRRQAIGLMAIGLLATAAFLLIGNQDQPEKSLGLGAAALRVGLLLGVIWYAYPSLIRLPLWIFMPTIGCLLILAVRPRLFRHLLPIAIPLALIIYFLRPRRGKK